MLRVSSKNLSLSLSTSSLLVMLSANPASADEPFELRFAAQILGEEFVCGREYANVGTTSSLTIPSDYRFFISNVRLLDAQGNATPVNLSQDGIWQYQDIALLDFEDGTGPCQNGNTALNTSIRGSVAPGQYTGVEFTMGIPFELNHQDILLAPSPLNLSAMFWNWQGGHRFFKFDMATSGRPVPPPEARKPGAMMMRSGDNPQRMGGMMRGGNGDDEEAAGFSVHIGSTGCAAESRTTAPTSACMNPNHVTVRFEQFDIAQDTVVADIGKVLADTNVDINTNETAPGCMSGVRDPECAQVLPGFGLAFEGKTSGPQQLFHRR